MSSVAQYLQPYMDKAFAEKLDIHWQLLEEANSRFNLTALKDTKEAAQKHYLDCLPAAEFVLSRMEKGSRIGDIGSGGGFPGLILALFCPEHKLVLMEAAQKKAAFLEEAAAAMGLKNVQVLAVRAEEAGRDKELRGSFDMLTARAVAEMAVLAEYCLPLLKKDGIFMAMKGAAAAEELEAARTALDILGGVYESSVPYTVAEAKRELIIIKKSGETPDKYPRRPGMPTKRPLK